MVEHSTPFSEADLRARGFEGFTRFGDLDLSQVPRGPGVYAVLRDFYSNHEVLPASVGGWFKGKDPSGDPVRLKPLLGCHSETLYIGKADAGTRDTRGLKKRITEFARFGQGKAVGHWGGRYIWQLSESQDLRIAWLAVTHKSAKEVEDELFAEFFEAYGQLPFANLRRPRRPNTCNPTFSSPLLRKLKMTSLSDIQQLVDFIETELPRDTWTPWPGGWPDQIEAALIDAVLSISAQYGTAQNGVRGAVAHYRADRGTDHPNDLVTLANYDPEELQTVLNNQKVSGRTKASAIVEAAGNLVAAGVKSAADLDPRNPAQKKAYTDVHGLGWVTWEYFGMLLGKPGIKADRWIVRFVNRALNREVSASEARSLLIEAATGFNATSTELDHAIWAYERDYQEPVHGAAE